MTKTNEIEDSTMTGSTSTPIPMASSSVETVNIDDSNASSNIQGPPELKSGWKHLFVFTKKAHVGPIIAALAATAFAAGFKTVLSVVLGRVFNIIAEFGNGSAGSSETLSRIGTWCLILLGLGIGNWLASMLFLSLWIVFGELQASSVRHDIFHSLLAKDMAWFDSQSEGISSLLVRIQT